MDPKLLSRRQFLRGAAALAGAALYEPRTLLAAAPRKRTAADQVLLGRTGIRCSRLGFGTGSVSGQVQQALGQAEFNRLVRYAFDRGITYLDCAEAYRTFEWIGPAIKGLPREQLFLQSKLPGRPADVLAAIDRHRKVFDTDYLDSLLIHCMVQRNWTDAWKRIMDGLSEAQARKWIRARGVSCHSLPALQAATASDWPEIHLVRVNPQGVLLDTAAEAWNAPSDASHLGPVLKEIKKLHARGRGVIGMKLIGEGAFKQPAERERAIRFAMAQPEIDCVVIGFKHAAEIDEASQRINRALAEG